MDPMSAVIRLERAVRDVQAILREQLVAGGLSAEEALRRVRDVVEDEDFVRFQRALEGVEASEETPTGPEDPLPYR
ncbi:hypothetical protein [Propylenella binzhouense]|uniref:Uncharacterized protein n=1 Tax=Propylenella binzhouense TaxID=2555902 RepID=A0A964T5B4_9HYPH|nr:hypothetical protein [Propylenella binzhouense]MYZ48796.1 hypothetical protein [Propylenella binzhouense]